MFFIVFLSAPACLLCGYLAWLCYRKALYPHTLVLALFAAIFLVVTVGVLSAGFFAGQIVDAETVSGWWSTMQLVAACLFH